MNETAAIEQKLRAFIAMRRNTPFNWATNNCGFFCADWVKYLTGKDPAAPWRDAVHDELSAHAVIDSFHDLRALVTSILGEPIALLTAQPGDIVLAPIAGGTDEGIGICLGQWAAFVGDDNLTRIAMRDALCAWRVS